MIIHLHFHLRATGVTRSVETIIPVLNKYTEALVFGFCIDAPKISFLSLLRQVYSNDRVVIHAHRNNEIIFALLLRLSGGKFKLVFTKHADPHPLGFTSFLIKKADNLVSLNRTMSKNLHFKNTLIRHGVNTEIYKIMGKRKTGKFAQENLITVIGRLRPSKGQLVAMEALIGPLRNNPDWGFLLIGKTDNKKYADKILSIARENGISSQVHFIPETRDIIDYYSISSIVVIPSLSEGFSLVCLEAMSCGLITIATESVGIHSEVINHGENGFLFQKNDVRALSLLISDIMSGKIKSDPEKIRQTIVDHWSVEQSVADLLKLYGISPGRAASSQGSIPG